MLPSCLRVLLTLKVALILLVLLVVLSLLLGRPLYGSIVRRVNVVVYVAVVIAHGGLLWSKPPLVVNDELVLVDTALESLDQCELVAVLLHGNALCPLVETAYQEYVLTPKVPREHDVNQVLLWHLGLLLSWLVNRLIVGVVAQPVVLAEDAAALGFAVGKPSLVKKQGTC